MCCGFGISPVWCLQGWFHRSPPRLHQPQQQCQPQPQLTCWSRVLMPFALRRCPPHQQLLTAPLQRPLVALMRQVRNQIINVPQVFWTDYYTLTLNIDNYLFAKTVFIFSWTQRGDFQACLLLSTLSSCMSTSLSADLLK